MMSKLNDSSPSAIAREALQRLATLKIPPTPDNYQKIYDQIAGNVHDQMNTNTKHLLSELATEIPRANHELINFSNTLTRAIRDNDWEKYKLTLLSKIIPVKTPATFSIKKEAQGTAPSWNKTIELLLKQLETNHGKLTIAKKREDLQHILMQRSDPSQLHEKIHALIESWKVSVADTSEKIDVLKSENTNQPTPAAGSIAQKTESGQARLVRDPVLQTHYTNQLPELLAHILEHVATIPLTNPAFTKETNDLAQTIRHIQNSEEMEQFINHYSQYLEKFDCSIEDGAKLQHGLLRLLHKLINSARELLIEDEWVRNQIAKLQETISRPLSQRSIAQAEYQLEEITQRQSIIKRSLSDSRETLIKMIASLISNIEDLSEETGEFSDKIIDCANQIKHADDLEVFNRLLVEIMSETRKMQEKTQHYRTDFIAARAEVEAAQTKINQLEAELQHISEKIHEDHLTGVLNRRGLDLAFEREISRTKRQQQPLCYALLDIDNFKKLNDTHGHQAGDEAIVFLIDSIKATTRTDDIVARYGGEEFIVLLPNTKLTDAVEILSRIRRNLMKRFFLYQNNRVLITFSAGIAECNPDETQEDVFKRADEALYRAKKNGKNLILEAV
ncbi:MAG: diguanylate cyclase [Nitrosomonas sp.]|nr:diguanylate cyclase [Nitrosomonas sp.]MCW5608447.1 diguanylate cyclase [Nitrosomonas sp.]